MKLIVMTQPFFFVEEHQILTALFDEGLDTLHVRKPGTEAVYSERLIRLLPEEYWKNVVVHDHFYLKSEFGLRGIHLNSRNPEPPEGYKGQKSCSCHTAEEVAAAKRTCDYVFLSPIFDSVSKPGHNAAFGAADLDDMARRRIIDRKVVALGGVTAENAPRLRDYGFGGCVVLGSLWQHFNVYQAQDFHDLIAYFRRLRRAIS